MKTVLSLLFLISTVSFSQNVTFSVEEIIVPPSQVTATKCVQLGVFMTYTGPTATWGHFEASLDYTLPADPFLNGTPFVDVSDFSVPGDPGLTNPGSPLANDGGSSTPCAGGDIINALTLLGSPGPINFMTGAGGPAAIVTESTVPGVSGGTIDITSLSFGSLFTTNDGETYLMAIIEFPLATGQGTGEIDVVFRNGAPSDNFITDGITTLAPTLVDGFIQVFETINCGDGTNFAVFDDAVGSGSASTLNGDTSLALDYLDPIFGGPGGEMDVTVNYGNGVSGYRIVGTDGFDTGIVSVAGPGNSPETINPVPGNNTYGITFYVLGLDGITLVPGSSCTLSQTWNAASCTATWTNNGIGGANSLFTVNLTNAYLNAGVFANVTVPVGATGITNFDITDGTGLTGTSGSTATLLLIDQQIPDGTWAGSWALSNLTSPDMAPGSACSDVLGFVCPVNNATVDQVTIGSTITVNLIGSDELNWDVTYNGVTTTGISPDDATFVTPNNASASASTLTVTANGVGPNGLPCPDTQVITLDFVAPSCDFTTQDPDSTVTPVDVGTVITLTLGSVGAITAEINGVPMALTSGTSGVDNNLVWEATHVAVADTTVVVTLTNPDGETTTCSWNIDINCIDPVIVSVAPVGQVGIVIAGTPDCVYTVRITEHNTGSITDYDVSVGADGLGTLNIVVPSDSWIEVGQLGFPIVTDMVMTVPTLGQWGLIGFMSLLMLCGLFIMKKNR